MKTTTKVKTKFKTFKIAIELEVRTIDPQDAWDAVESALDDGSIQDAVLGAGSGDFEILGAYSRSV